MPAPGPPPDGPGITPPQPSEVTTRPTSGPIPTGNPTAAPTTVTPPPPHAPGQTPTGNPTAAPTTATPPLPHAPGPTPGATLTSPASAAPGPVLPGTPGLPTGPTGDGPLTPTPAWKRRNGRRGAGAKIAIALVVLGGLVAAGWFALNRSSGEQPAAADPADDAVADDSAADDGTLIGETQELVDGINDRPELDEALGSLGLDGEGRPTAPTAGDEGSGPPTPAAAPGSYTFRWTDSLRLDLTVDVDVATGDFRAIAVGGLELRRVGGRYAGRPPGDEWVELPTTMSAIPLVGDAGPVGVSDVVPEQLEPFVVARDESTDGQLRLLVDDAALAREENRFRLDWLGAWGLLDLFATPEDAPPNDGAVPATASAGQVVIDIDVGADGTVTHATLSSPAIGGTATYTLTATSPEPIVVEFPDIPPGG